MSNLYLYNKREHHPKRVHAWTKDYLQRVGNTLPSTLRLIGQPPHTQYATQCLVQALFISKLDSCNAILTGLPAFAVRPLQTIQNGAAHLVFDQPKRTHVTLLVILHWLPVAVRIKSLVLTCHWIGTSLFKCYDSPSRPLRSCDERLLSLLSLSSKTLQSRLFWIVVPRQGNDLPSAVHFSNSFGTLKKQLKTHLSKTTYV